MEEMSVAGGYMGRILRIDLSKNKIVEDELREETLRRFLGGFSLGVKILFDEVPSGIEPFDPDNRLIIVTSPLVGTVWPASCQYIAFAKSPLTDLLGLARSKGFFAPELKFAGYDGVIIQGKAESPVYLWVYDGKTEIRDATHLWGKDTFETEDLIKKELNDPRVRVTCIGQAGEVLSRMACIMNDRGHAAARCGIGAVMGSKKLKAIAVRGTKKVPVANSKKLLELRKEWLKLSSENKSSRVMSDYGTAGDYSRTEGHNVAGDLPTKNWTHSMFQEWRKLSGQYMREKYPTKKTPCFNCPIGHDYIIEIPSGPYMGTYVYPEYENTAAFGCNIGNSDTEAMIKLSDIANRYGIDTIECSHVISFLMECFEKGRLKKEDLEGIELTWGNAEAVMQILDKIVKRDGIGDILAEGVKRAADSIGVPDVAIHVKKMSPILHDLRHHWGWLISYLVAPAGPTHMGIGTANEYTLDPDIDFHDTGPFAADGKGEAAKKAHVKWLGLDCLGICAPTSFGIPLSLHLKALSAVTGWEINIDEFIKIVERGVTLARRFNIQNGLKPADDWPSGRILEPPSDGPAKGVAASREAVKKMLKDYYRLMRWNPRTGEPGEEDTN